MQKQILQLIVLEKQILKGILEVGIMPMDLTNLIFIINLTEDGRSMATFYHYSVNHQYGLKRNTFSKLSYIFLIHQKVPKNMSFHMRYMMVS